MYNRPKTFYVFLISSLYPYQASNTKQTHPVATDTHVILNCERINDTFCAIFILWGSKFTTLICCKTKYGNDSHMAVPPTHWLGETGKYDIFWFFSDFLIKISMFQCLPLTWRWKYHIFVVIFIFWLKMWQWPECLSASHRLGDPGKADLCLSGQAESGHLSGDKNKIYKYWGSTFW